ncbi:hypothetical protein KAR48_06890 [bacterium]|nr:hypothetical protein [bacterium]
MKKRVIVFLFAVLMPALLLGQGFVQPGFSGDAGVVSRYIWRGMDMMPDNAPTAQLNMNYVFGMSGISFSASGSMAMRDRDLLKAGDEAIFVLDYSKVGEKFGFTFGLNNYLYPNAGGDSYSPEIYTGISFQSIIMFPTLTFYYDFNLADDWYVSLSGGQFVPIGERLFTLGWVVGYNHGQFGTDPGISHIDITLSTDVFPFGQKVTPVIGYVITPGDRVNIENEFWFGARWAF